MSTKTASVSSRQLRSLQTIRYLAFAALAVSAYLAYASGSGSGVAGCAPDSGCDQVLSSRWSSWLGIPVSFAALVLYTGVLVATFQFGRKSSVAQQRFAWAGLLASAVLILGAVVWFVALQLWVIKAICPFCMTAHGLGAMVAGIILASAPIHRPEGKPWQQEKQVRVTPAQTWKLAGGALLGVAILVSGQLGYQPKAYVLKLFNSPLEVDVNRVPLIGSPDAPHVMVSLFDYSCHFCRIMHGHLLELHRTFGKQLAIANLPMPLAPGCNYTVKRAHPDHIHACEYARLGLAVWRADSSKMATFDEFMFGPERPPSVEAATQFAGTLVGTNALATAEKDPWIEQQLLTDVHIYATNYYHFQQGGNMPQLIIGTNFVSGILRSVQDLYPILSNNFGLVPPTR